MEALMILGKYALAALFFTVCWGGVVLGLMKACPMWCKPWTRKW